MLLFGECGYVCCASNKICCNCCRTKGPKPKMDDQPAELAAARENFVINQMNEASFRMRLIFLGLNAKEIDNEVRDLMPKRTNYILETMKGSRR